jgi:hypothetical protein
VAGAFSLGLGDGGHEVAGGGDLHGEKGKEADDQKENGNTHLEVGICGWKIAWA